MLRASMLRVLPMNPVAPRTLRCVILHFILGLTALALSARAAAPARKPNFLFIYTDDQRWDAMSVVQREQGDQARFPWFQTPNMDRLAAEGVRFRNAFVTLSLCAPSRAETGRQAWALGTYRRHIGKRIRAGNATLS